MNKLHDNFGKRIVLGKKIGEGGEGSVYDIESDKGIAAKIYNSTISQKKQDKLISMVNCRNSQLENFTAWPLSTLHRNGNVCGFLMPKAVNFEIVHHYYSPAQRKYNHPEINWAFLIHIARNIAVAFSVIHSFGHVIGDVNPNLVFVSKDSTVKLIDCDV